MLFNKIRDIATHKVIQNVSWLGASELANRIFRLGTTVTLSRFFDPKEYGLMAILYILLEFAQVFIWGGITAKIVHSDEEDLQSICDTSYWINWIICIAAFLLQCLLAYPIAQFCKSDQLFLPLCLSATTYLIIPFFLVKASLIERENRMKEIAFINSAQSISSNLIIIVLAILGAGIWSIAITMPLSTLMWLTVNLRKAPWKMPRKVTFHNWRKVVGYGKNTLGVQLLNKLRGSLDYLIILNFLDPDSLGWYYFAFNAGSGITTNIANTFVWALFPHLCSVRQNPQKFKTEYFRYLKITMATITSIVVLQSLLPYFYVPLIFGEKWIPAIPILVIICLSVIPTSLKLVGSILLNADDKPHLTLYFDIAYTIIFLLGLLIAVQWGDPDFALYRVAFAVLTCHSIMGILFSIFSTQIVFGEVKVS